MVVSTLLKLAMSVLMSESIARPGASAGVRAAPSFEIIASAPTVEIYPTTFPLRAVSILAENLLREIQPERSQAVSSASFADGALQARIRPSMSTRQMTFVCDFMTPPISNDDSARSIPAWWFESLYEVGGTKAIPPPAHDCRCPFCRCEPTKWARNDRGLISIHPALADKSPARP